MLNRFLLVIVFCCTLSTTSQAQDHELGAWLGTGTYVGDLNPDYSFQKTRPALGLVYRYHAFQYIGLRVGLSYAHLQHSDDISANPFQLKRNLSFRTNVFELSGQIDLHFKKFIVGSKKDYFTPYLTTGLALFHFNPQAKYEDKWYNLRQLGTEGQQNRDFTGRVPYNQVQFAIPVGAGIKYWMGGKWNFYFEIATRQTFTDYLDDVSTTYVDPFLLDDGSVAVELADRSDEVGNGSFLGREGKQRGNVVDNDAYIVTNIGITYTIVDRKCPKAK